MDATLCVGRGLWGEGLAISLWMISRSEAISMGFTRTLSARKRIADRASSSSGYPLSTSVAAFGWVWRMALTTVKPSPAWGMCRSESSTSKFSAAIRLSASRTFATATTSNPSRSNAACSILRTASSSSASKILGTLPSFPPLRDNVVLIFTEEGHLLHSGNPNRLWFRFRLGFGAKNPIQGNRLDRYRLLYEAEEELATAL